MTPPVETILREQFPEIFGFIDADECGLGYSPIFREFSLQVRGSSKSVRQTIYHCPFTGTALPLGLRDEYFNELEALGLEDGLADIPRAPMEFQSEAWWIARDL